MRLLDRFKNIYTLNIEPGAYAYMTAEQNDPPIKRSYCEGNIWFNIITNQYFVYRYDKWIPCFRLEEYM